MGERDEVCQHGENLFPRFKCMYCLKEFRGSGATRLKEHLAGKGGNISQCNKCPPNIRNYFLRELQMIREWKKVKKEERFHRVQSTMPLSDDEDEELQEAVESPYSPSPSSCPTSTTMLIALSRPSLKLSLGEPCRRGKGLETLMPQEPLHLYKLG
jgi:hypothetical protein